jgi:hypothetical protein
MKTTMVSKIRYFMLAVIAALMSVVSFAQDGGGKVDVNITTDKNNFWASPWVWVVGGAVFVLLLVAILRGGGSKSDA